MVKKRSSIKTLLITATTILTSVILPSAAHATTTSFNCGTSGTYQVDSATHTITGNTSCKGALAIDSSVTAIGNTAFAYNHDLTAITIPSSVTTIGQFAFREAYFDSIVFNEGLITLDSYAFYGTYNREATLSITLPNSLTTIGNAVFGQSRFGSISIGPNLSSLGSEVFYNNFGFGPTSITFRGMPSFTQLQDTVFIGFRGLELDLPSSITSIGTRAFEGAEYLTYLILPPQVTQLASYSLQEMSNLHTLVIPETTTSIGANSFASDPELRTVLYCGTSAAVLNYSYPNGTHPVCAKGAIFLANGGSGSMRSETGTSTANLTTNTYTKSGSNFIGWNTEANGSGTNYANNAPFPFTSTTVLYAQWRTVVVPDAPTLGSATVASATSASISFNAPASDGGATIDFYECESSPTTSTVTLNQSGSGRCEFTGLTTGTPYQFNVRAHNSIGYSNYTSLSNAVTPSDTIPDPEAEKREAERKRQQEIDTCKTSLKAALASNSKIEPGTFAKCGYRPLTNPSEVTVVSKLQSLPIDSRTAESVLTAVITKIGIYEDLQGKNAQSVTPQQLVQTGIIEANVPNKTVITLQLQKLDQTARDTIAEIDAFIALEAKKMQERKERLASTITRIHSR